VEALKEVTQHQRSWLQEIGGILLHCSILCLGDRRAAGDWRQDLFLGHQLSGIIACLGIGHRRFRLVPGWKHTDFCQMVILGLVYPFLLVIWLILSTHPKYVVGADFLYQTCLAFSSGSDNSNLGSQLTI